MVVTNDTALHLPYLHRFEHDGVSYLLDPSAPNWVAVDARGSWLVDAVASGGQQRRFGGLVAAYASAHELEAGKAWVHVHDFVRALDRSKMLRSEPREARPYPGRAALAAPEGLRELWIQVNNACNLSCTHCLVSSGPGKDPGPPIEHLMHVVDQACALGLERLYLTGGEPFVRKDIFRLIRHAGEDRGLEVIVLTNGTAFKGAVRTGAGALDPDLVRFQVSVDGASSATHDAFRGPGTFTEALGGAGFLAEQGFRVALTTVATAMNLDELPLMPPLAREVGAESQHLMWPLRRGRAADAPQGVFPDMGRLRRRVGQTARAAEDVDVQLDNVEVVKRRVNGVPGVKYDLGNGGWDSLCVYADGRVFPTAALVGDPRLLCGDSTRTPLEQILGTSPVVARLRRASLVENPAVRNDPYRFFTGGGDWEHAWWATGNPVGQDPYYPIARDLVEHVMTRLGTEKLARRNLRSGYDAPLVLHAMGEGAIACGVADASAAEQEVLTLHSNCVLSFDVDKPREKVREFYGEAADEPQADLCCPTRYDAPAVAHIPQDVLDRFYGCGSPLARAGIQPGETVVDLGSGAGIDVFIAARAVGPGGSVIGVDMTDEMLAVARENNAVVARSLGFDVARFEKGFLEALPLESGSADLITSNCVINLSPDKPRVFAEMWRVLRDHGRIVVSDIVSEVEVPPRLKVDPRLWGECLVGALTQEAFLSELERAGFFGLTVQERTYWKDVEGYSFFSVTVEGRKLEKSAGCVYLGHRAVYLGPGKAFVDEEGHLFPRNEPYEVCTDTVAKLVRPPYRDMFAVLEPGHDASSYACCSSTKGCC